MQSSRHRKGLTCDQVEQVLSERHQSVSARIRELVIAGRIYDSGERRATRSGKEARVYRVSGTETYYIERYKQVKYDWYDTGDVLIDAGKVLTPTQYENLLTKLGVDTELADCYITLAEDRRENGTLAEQVKQTLEQKKAKKTGNNFYKSIAWLTLRYQVIMIHGGICQCCGRRPTLDNPLNIDHIKPRSKSPELALDIENLQVLCGQVLCGECNIGKSNLDCSDWRWAPAIMPDDDLVEDVGA